MRSERTERDERDWVDVLTRCAEACRAGELHCTIAMDVVVALHDDPKDGPILGECAAVCARTASSIGALREPDVDAIADVLALCRAACGAAQRACRKRPFDACCGACAEICGECAEVCGELLAATRPIAA